MATKRKGPPPAWVDMIRENDPAKVSMVELRVRRGRRSGWETFEEGELVAADDWPVGTLANPALEGVEPDPPGIAARSLAGFAWEVAERYTEQEGPRLDFLIILFDENGDLLAKTTRGASCDVSSGETRSGASETDDDARSEALQLVRDLVKGCGDLAKSHGQLAKTFTESLAKRDAETAKLLASVADLVKNNGEAAIAVASLEIDQRDRESEYQASVARAAAAAGFMENVAQFKDAAESFAAGYRANAERSSSPTGREDSTT